MSRLTRVPRLRLLRRLSLAVILWIGLLLSSEALAAPPTGGSASASSSGRSSGFQPPDFVYGGNSLSFLGPVQVGLTRRGYIPRARLGFQYDRQLHRAHWLHVGFAGLFDRGRWDDFRMPRCGVPAIGACQVGTTAGLDVWVGYTYKVYIEKYPWIVPTFRAGLAGGFWKYPELTGTRQQSRELSWMLGLQAGAGVRFFLLRELAVGLDLELRPGFVIHREHLVAAIEPETESAFILPLQILPLLVEWRF